MIRVARILGLLGGIGGTMLTSLIILVIWARRILARIRPGSSLVNSVSIWSYFIFVFAVIGIVGAALVESKPKTGGILMLISGIAGVVAVGVAFIVAGRLSVVDLVEGIFSLLLLVSGILGINSFSRQKVKLNNESKI